MAAQKGDYQPIRLVGAAFALGFVAFLLYQRISLYVRRRQFKKLHGCQPPQGRYVGKDPIFGLDLIWRNFQNAKKKVFLESAYKRYLDKGFTLSVRVAGTKIITTIEPENVKTILSLKFKDFSLGNRGPMQEFLGFGIFTTDGERWANSRHMIRPNFVKEQVADLEAFERHIQAMLKKIPTDGTTVDLQELFFQLTIDSATEFLFGESVNSLRYGDIGFAGAFNYSLHDVLTNFRMGPYKRFRRADPKAVEANRICHEFVDKFVDDAIVYREKHANAKEGEEKEEKYVFLHELAKAMGDRRRLRDELLNILLAGRDTTASLLSNMFFELAQKPHMYAKLRAEVSQLKGAKPSYETLKNMKYLKYCMNESLRIHPVVPGNSRLCIKDSFLPLGGGPDGKSPVFVEKGTIVSYSPYSMHRRKDYYGPDAEEFRPERWETLRPGWEYLPFNGGPRICLGQQYALTEAGYVTLRIVQEFEKMESRDERGEWQESLTLTLCSHNGCKVALTKAETW